MDILILVHLDGKVLLTVLPFNAKRDNNVSGVNELFYSLLANVENNEILIILKEIEDGSILAGLRSKEYFDVGELAKYFGGGGHKHASGFKIKNTALNLLENQIIAYIKDAINF
ncbi:Phosphoesterase, DHH family protein [Borrelia duttonii CR2A]|uniref:Phosphoesterase, DHH family protein n=1 Tax=Borrelia duttonii CR2A TaxID=1432657 RepID=W6TMX6_9SPIR|nr:Phosphoesterase, DHH family protein [Borrelia duttonii CR2A]